MEFREDLVYSVSEYTSNTRGLWTLGEFREIQLENGDRIQLYPYLLETHCTRGVSAKDPRRRMRCDDAISLLSLAYAEHYNNANLGEHWTVDEVKRMLRWQSFQSYGRYFLVKWAKNLETEVEFPIGFFCAYTKPYYGGDTLWDGELFVLSDFRKYGIGTELVEAMFTLTKVFGVSSFESLTYANEDGFPFKFWHKLGIEASDLIHIYGNTEQILETIQEKKNSGIQKSLSIL